MRKIVLTPFFVLALLSTSCSNDSDDDIGPIIIDPPPTALTYTNTVKPIMSSKCTNCHNNPPTNNAPMSLITYTDVKNAVQNRGLVNRVENGTMPPSGSSLTSSQIQSIKDWQSGGFVE